ncbi:MAG: hypothetical protein Unbinned5081contig1002_25 [Prokaryotic dsDNA virus sp.]|nr:MAG: hypothetical protein Unbinned5081contig1002_25 [Prokaryotic dsDNA virus sp.]|tara:strand:- start:35353 stop:35787 length:435 start_codon:yes stop_codon:yes gene_type:complete
MYKPDKQRVEDCLIPYVIRQTLLLHNKDIYSKAIEYLTEDIEAETKGNQRVDKRLMRVTKKLFNYFHKNNWKTNKVFMVMSHIAASLVEDEQVLLGSNSLDIIKEINETVVRGYEHKEGIKEIDISAAKQAPKIFKLIQEEGYF